MMALSVTRRRIALHLRQWDEECRQRNSKGAGPVDSEMPSGLVEALRSQLGISQDTLVMVTARRRDPDEPEVSGDLYVKGSTTKH